MKETMKKTDAMTKTKTKTKAASAPKVGTEIVVRVPPSVASWRPPRDRGALVKIADAPPDLHALVAALRAAERARRVAQVAHDNAREARGVTPFDTVAHAHAHARVAVAETAHGNAAYSAAAAYLSCAKALRDATYRPAYDAAYPAYVDALAVYGGGVDADTARRLAIAIAVACACASADGIYAAYGVVVSLDAAVDSAYRVGGLRRTIANIPIVDDYYGVYGRDGKDRPTHAANYVHGEAIRAAHDAVKDHDKACERVRLTAHVHDAGRLTGHATPRLAHGKTSMVKS